MIAQCVACDFAVTRAYLAKRATRNYTARKQSLILTLSFATPHFFLEVLWDLTREGNPSPSSFSDICNTVKSSALGRSSVRCLYPAQVAAAG